MFLKYFIIGHAYLADLGHVTKMPATPICGKTLQKSTSTDPVGRLQCNSVCSIKDASPS